MCELLVRVVSKENSDPYLDAKCMKRGDVVTVQPDGWAWGREELTNPHWRILSVPGVAVEDAAAFTSPEVAADPSDTAMLQARGFGFDLDHPLLARIAAQIADDDRRPAVLRLPISLPALMALKVRKAPLADPNVFG